MKVIGHVAAALPLLEKAGVSNSHDDGFIVLKSNDCSAFVEACRKLRCWTRAAGAKQEQAA
jgi:catalase